MSRVSVQRSYIPQTVDEVMRLGLVIFRTRIVHGRDASEHLQPKFEMVREDV